MRGTRGDQPNGDQPGGPLFWGSVAVGWTVIAVAVRGLLAEADWAANPDGFGRFLVTSALVHDLLLAPLALGAGVLVARLVPARVRAPVQAGLIASAVVTIVAWPFVRGYGRAATNPSALPWDYGRNLVLLLGAIWLVAGAAAVWRLSRGTRDRAIRPAPRPR